MGKPKRQTRPRPRRPIVPNESWIYASHEAGHAVAAIHYGIPFAKASTVRGGTDGGRLNDVEFPNSMTSVSHDVLWSYLVMTLAGPIAQAALAGFGFVGKAGLDDLKDAYVMTGQWICGYLGSQWEEVEEVSEDARADIDIQLELTARIAVDLVYDHAYLFMVVAEDLLLSRELSRNQINEIVREFACDARLVTADLEVKLPRQRFADRVINEFLKPNISSLCGDDNVNKEPRKSSTFCAADPPAPD